MAYDPCSLLPDTHVPAGLAAPREHAAYHVVGRILHRAPAKRPHVWHPQPRLPVAGCDQRAPLSRGVLPTSPSAPAAISPGIAALGGAVFGGVGGIIGEIGHIMPGGKKHGHHPVPVPEPATLLLLVGAVVIMFGMRHVGRRKKEFFFEKKNQKTFASWWLGVSGIRFKNQKFFASFFQKRRPFF